MRQREPQLSALYREHFDFVWRCLARHGVASADLEDAAQEVFLVVHRRLQEFEAERACMRGWLYGIVKRVASNRRRSALRRQRFLVSFGQWRRGASASETSLEPSLAARESLRLLDRCLAELEPGQRDAFILFEFEGMSGQEVATALGIPQPTAFSRRRLARARLREQLEAVATGASELAQRPAPAAARTRVWALCLPCFSGSETASATSGPALPEPGVASSLWSPLFIGAAATSITVAAVAVAPRASADTPVVRSQEQTVPTIVASVAKPGPAVVGSKGADIETAPRNQAPPLETNRATKRTKLRKKSARGARIHREVGRPAPSAVGGLAAETNLVERARADLETGHARAALVALDEHRRRYPNGFLQDAATLLRVQALQKTGQSARAERVIDAFHQRKPGSALGPRFEALRGAAGSG